MRHRPHNPGPGEPDQNRLVRHTLPIVALFLLGCSTASPSPGGLADMPSIRTVTVGSVSSAGDAGNRTIRFEDDPIVIRRTLEAPPREVWPLLLDAYRAQGLVPGEWDVETLTLATAPREVSREWEGEPLQRFLDCGSSTTGRPLADDSRVSFAMASQLSGDPQGPTELLSRLEAVAFPFEAGPGRAQTCRSTGEMERRIVERVRAALGSPAAPSEPEGGAASGGMQPAGLPSAIVLPGIEPGDRVRITTFTEERHTGRLIAIRPDSLLMRTSRATAIPMASVASLKRYHAERGPILAGAALGAAAGIALAVGTDLGISSTHQAQGRILNPGLGAIGGGLAGAFLAWLTVGHAWVDIPLEILPVVGTGTGAGLGVRSSWRPPWP